MIGSALEPHRNQHRILDTALPQHLVDQLGPDPAIPQHPPENPSHGPTFPQCHCVRSLRRATKHRCSRQARSAPHRVEVNITHDAIAHVYRHLCTNVGGVELRCGSTEVLLHPELHATEAPREVLLTQTLGPRRPTVPPLHKGRATQNGSDPIDAVAASSKTSG